MVHAVFGIVLIVFRPVIELCDPMYAYYANISHVLLWGYWSFPRTGAHSLVLFVLLVGRLNTSR